MNANDEPAKYEYFDHTADVGILIRGKTIEDIFVHGALALTDLITEVELVRPERRYKIRIDAVDIADLLVKWLNELVYLADVDNFLPSAVEVISIEEDRIEAEVQGETLQPRRHPRHYEIKSVTHHGLSITGNDEDGWQAKLIADI